MCISASWDTVVNCLQNNIAKMDDLQVWEKYLFLLVGFIRLVYPESQSAWVQIEARETNASTPPDSLKESSDCDITTRHHFTERQCKTNEARVTLHPRQKKEHMINKHLWIKKPHGRLNKIQLIGQEYHQCFKKNSKTTHPHTNPISFVWLYQFLIRS